MGSDDTEEAAAEAVDLYPAVAVGFVLGEVLVVAADVVGWYFVGCWIDCCCYCCSCYHGSNLHLNRSRCCLAGPAVRLSIDGQCAIGCAYGGDPYDRNLLKTGGSLSCIILK